MTGPRWDVGNGEGTGRHIELRVQVLVGTQACKVIVEPVRGGPAHVEVASYAAAGRVAGDVVVHLVSEAVAGFQKSESLD
jgi:hypothetical protein